jgi:hypothetical protein
MQTPFVGFIAAPMSAAERIDGGERVQILLKRRQEHLPVSRAFTDLFRD